MRVGFAPLHGCYASNAEMKSRSGRGGRNGQCRFGGMRGAVAQGGRKRSRRSCLTRQSRASWPGWSRPSRLWAACL